jgi:NNP family nitrate/nitrite transporter-like MFS transporter
VWLAKDSPNQPAPKPLADYWGVLGERDTWWFSLFYSVTFGGFVGLASFLSIFFRDQYELSRVAAGTLATLCVAAGSFLRPAGGFLADRFGGIRVLTVLFIAVGCVMLGVSTLPVLGVATASLFVGMGCLGMGNGAVFQLVPQRFSREIGVITGIVGAAGGLGGFILPNVLGSIKQLTGSFGGGFVVFSVVAYLSAGALLSVSRTWQGAFVAEGGLAEGLIPVAVEAD